MLSDYPLVTVVIPTYNYSQYITHAIDSVLNQTYQQDKIEIIVVDDGSTDNTQDVLKPLIDCGRIRYHYQSNAGKANATKQGILLSRGEYFFNLDADDLFLPEKIAMTVEVFLSNSNIVHVATPARILKCESNGEAQVEVVPSCILNKAIDGNYLLNFFYKRNILFGGGTTYAARISILRQVDIPDETDMYIDEFLLLSVLQFGNSYFISHPLSIWRIHKSNYSELPSNNGRGQKLDRLAKSSRAILSYLEVHEFDRTLIKIYRLKDAIRRISFKEIANNKSITEIMIFAHEVFFKIRPTPVLISKYKVFNRLIPLHIYKYLKKLMA